MTQLSNHFWLREFTRSENAARYGIDNTPSDGVVYQLRLLCEQVLEPLRADVCEALGRDVSLYITSGYRSTGVNTLAKGSERSDHLFGRAADVVAIGVPLADFAKIAMTSAASLPVKQCIVEFGEWIHISIDIRQPPRREYLVATRANGATLYTPYSDGGLA